LRRCRARALADRLPPRLGRGGAAGDAADDPLRAAGQPAGRRRARLCQGAARAGAAAGARLAADAAASRDPPPALAAALIPAAGGPGAMPAGGLPLAAGTPRLALAWLPMLLHPGTPRLRWPLP